MFRIVILTAFLTVTSIMDIKKRRVNLLLCICVTVMGMIYNLCHFRQQEMLNCMAAVLPGLILMMLAIVTHEKIGIGDGIIVTIIGLFTNIQTVVCTVVFAILLSAMVSLVLMTVKKAALDTEIPFVPLLAMSVILTLVGMN